MKRTVEVRADGEAARLAGRDGLRDAEQRCAERADAFLAQLAAGVERGSRRRDLDAEPVFGNTRLVKLMSVGAGVGNSLGLIVGVKR